MSPFQSVDSAAPRQNQMCHVAGCRPLRVPARRRRRSALLYTALSLALAALPATPAHADDFTWSGFDVLTNNWGALDNWDFRRPPPVNGFTTSHVIFNSGGPLARYHPDLDSNYSIHALNFTLDPIWGPASFNLESSTNKTLTIGSGGITNTADRKQTLHHAVSIGANQTWNAVNGNLVTHALTGGGDLTLKAAPFYEIIFNGPSNFTGRIRVMEGQLTLNSGAALNSLNAVTIDPGAKMVSATSSLVIMGSLSGSGILDLQNGGTLALGVDNGSADFSGILRGIPLNNSLAKAGTGVQTLSGTAGGTTFFGNYHVLEGTLRLAGGFQMNTFNAVFVSSGAVLDLNNTDQEFAVLLDKSGDPGNGGSVLIGTGSLTIGAVNGTFSGSLSGTGKFVKTGSQSQTLKGNSSGFTGDLEVNQGTLVLSDTASLGPVRAAVNGGTLRFENAGQALFGLSGTGGQLELSPASLFLQQFGNTAFAGEISGSGGINMVGTGALTLTGNNTYTGGTAVNLGRVTVASTGSLAPNGAVTLNGGELKLENPTQTVSRLSGATGKLVLNPTVLTIDQAADTSFLGQISGSGGITKQGAGTLTLLGNNIFTGNVRVEAGTLAVVAGTTPSAATDVLGGGTLRVGGGAFNATGPVNNAGNINLAGGALNATTININPGGAFNFTGGTLSIETFNGDLINQGGMLSPGHSPGMTNVTGNFTQAATGKTWIEIAGTAGPGVGPDGHDQVNVAGTANLSGTLATDLIGGFTPNYGDTFTILTADEIAGSFVNRGEFIDAVDFTINGQAPGVFRLGTSNVALVPLLKLNPSGPDTVTLVTTAPGDLNLDGRVNIGDFLTFQNNFNDPGNWFDGDFNGDGLVNIGDFLLLQNNFNDVFFTPAGGAVDPALSSEEGLALLAEFAAAQGVNTPESGSAAVVLLAMTVPVLTRRRAH